MTRNRPSSSPRNKPRDRPRRGSEERTNGADPEGPPGRERERRPSKPAPEPLRIPADEIDPRALDEDANRVVARLQRGGHEAYLVGGCVRDLMIGRVPKDFDVATSAHPQEIKRLFRNGRIIGRRFRLVHVYYGDHIIETATFRAEREDRGDGGKDEDLLIVEDNEYGTAAEDARRRDFTVNALFLDPTKGEILDFVDGLEDLEARVLRTIGDPMVRMAEDPVRIMRAIKFATRLDFEIDEPTWDAMAALAPHLTRSAPPRVLEEILRLMRSGTALGAFRMLRACGALRVILPEIDKHIGPRRGADEDTHTRAEGFWRLLEALDSEVHQGYEPTTAVCIAVLFSQLVERETNPDTRTLPGEPGDVGRVCWEVMEPLSMLTRLSRRDFGRARRIIGNQRHFTETPSKRFSPLLFARTEDFPESMDLFGLRVEARGKGWDIFEGWQGRYDRALKASPEELEQERKLTRRRKRRRKGRGGNRRSSSPRGSGEG